MKAAFTFQMGQFFVHGSIIRFQFILEREAGIYFYGSTKQPDHFIIPVNSEGSDQALIAMRTTQFEFPVLEYRPFHNFRRDQTASLCCQFYWGFDLPGKATSVIPRLSACP